MSMRIESEADLQQIVDGVAEGRWWVRRGSGVGKYNGGYTGLVCVRTGKFIARMDLSLIERLWDILDPESPAERRKRTMTGNVDDLREGIRAGLSEDMKTEADNMDDMADRIESERPGGINVGAGGNGIAGIGRRLVVGGRPVCEKERFQIDGLQGGRGVPAEARGDDRRRGDPGQRRRAGEKAARRHRRGAGPRLGEIHPARSGRPR